MKFLKNRVLPFLCALSILISLCVVSASAAFPDEFRDDYAVADWNSKLLTSGSSSVDLLASHFNVSATVQQLFWTLVDMNLGPNLGPMSRGDLNSLAESFNSYFRGTIGETFAGQIKNGTAEVYANVLARVLIGAWEPNFTVEKHPSSGLYRIKENHTGLFVVNSAGAYPYVDPAENDGLGSDQWVPISSMNNGSFRMLSYDALYNLADDVGGRLVKYNNYWVIKRNTSGLVEFVLANVDGKPYVCWQDKNQSATSQERPTTNVTENGDVIEGDFTDNSVNLDLEGMTMLLPGGTFAFIDNLVYDESTKSYHIDSHDTINYTVNNYYTWNYYINYTSITYIGQTEEYNKYYEVYYELPDGRDSADLTKEDLEQLNLSIDVIPYGRSADDTSLRSLYHFDGDTKDSSYWNYCTDFTWNKGASLTYMDAGVFDGALYLDELVHDFTLTLPSNIGSGDFTLQFRYYQSATLAPVTDSYINVGGFNIIQFNGASLLNGSGGVLATIPVGTWNEIALIRSNGIIYWYLNGVCVGNGISNASLNHLITFHFGTDQQTFKYLDEIRVLNKSLVAGGSSYIPTSVPHDTNLSLVLPDSVVPVADEYWKITSTGDNLFQYDLTLGSNPGLSSNSSSDLIVSNYRFPTFVYNTNYTRVSFMDGFTHIEPLKTTTDKYYNRAGLLSTSSESGTHYIGSTGPYVFSVVMADGSIYSLNISDVRTTKSADFDWGSLICYQESGWDAEVIGICPTKPIDVMYVEIVAGSSTDLTAELVTSVTVFDKDSLQTPTLAVRTDIDITSYQIGGVRPSIPEKGQVWAMVENDRIVSIQIYNGQAWEGVDGRIWTGQRWIPASSYNIITLQDMYDIVDATPNYEYIYSEAGFWAWWQKSWNAFTEKLFQALGSGGSGGSSIVPGTVKQKVSEALSSLIEGIFGTITEVLKSLIGAASDLLSGIFSFFSDTVFGGIRDFFSSFDELINPFETTIENEDGSTTTSPGLPDDVVTGLGFFSGLIMLIPDEVRVVLFFFAGLTLFIAILKRFA